MTTIISEAQLYLNSNCKYSYKQFMVHVNKNMQHQFPSPKCFGPVLGNLAEVYI